jgi:FkbM family methyltransferase
MPNLSRATTATLLKAARWFLFRIGSNNRSWLARQLVSPRRDPQTLALVDFCNRITLAWKNKQYDIRLNGEQALLNRLSRLSPSVLMDAGANIGEWSLAALAAIPSAFVHAFEIAEPTAVQLKRNLAPFPSRAVANAFGLGDRDGDLTVYLPKESNTAASVFRTVIEVSAEDHGIKNVAEIRSTITTGDGYMHRNGVSHVDVLKIDVEGAEMEVLKGFSGAFERQAIDLVQFEYGPLNLSTRVFLSDFYDFFNQRGYVIGKLFPEGVAFKPFEPSDEDFVGPNFIACLESRTHIIEAISWV